MGKDLLSAAAVYTKYLVVPAGLIGLVWVGATPWLLAAIPVWLVLSPVPHR